MSTTVAAPPLATSLIESDPTNPKKLTGFITSSWNQWLLALIAKLQLATLAVKTTTRTLQAAAIATTAAYTATASGLYRVSYVVRVTRAATTSSSITVTLGWVETAVTLSQAFAALTGNTVTTVQTGSVLVRADSLSDLTFAVAYASVGATAMQFRIDVVVEWVS